MKSRFSIIRFALLMALSGNCYCFDTIAGSEIASVAKAELELRADGHVISLIGAVRDIKVSERSKSRIVAEKISPPLDSPRQKVLVDIEQNGVVLTKQVVWFAISKPIRALVYSKEYEKLMNGSSVAVVYATCDMLTHEKDAVENQELISGLRLKRHVKAGAPVLFSDFESLPDVTAGQFVEIESIRGSARILTGGKIVSEGKIGQSVFVIANDGESKISAKVVSGKRVVVEK